MCINIYIYIYIPGAHAAAAALAPTAKASHNIAPSRAQKR